MVDMDLLALGLEGFGTSILAPRRRQSGEDRLCLDGKRFAAFAPLFEGLTCVYDMLLF
jgi:hypothetical protein